MGYYILALHVKCSNLQLIFVWGMRGPSIQLQKGVYLWSCVLSSTNLILEWLHDPLSFLMSLQIVQLVSVVIQFYIHTPASVSVWLIIITEAPEDYISDSGLLFFATGDREQCHTVLVVNNIVCDVLEQFLSNLTLLSGIPRIAVDPDSSQIIIKDTDDCCKCVSVGLCLNDCVLITLSHSS